MKVSLVQVACPASTGNVDFTDAAITNDLVGAIFFQGRPTANDTTTARAGVCMGATDLAGNVCFTYDMADATAGAAASGTCSSASAFKNYTAGTGFIGPTATYGSTLSNGVRMAYSAVTSGVLTSALLISGSDVAMKVGSAQFGTTDTTNVVTHGLGGTPDIIIVFVGGNQTATDVVAQSIGHGMWERTGTQSVSSSMRFQSAANPTSGNAYISSADVGKSLANGSVTATFTLSAVGATQFTFNRANTGLSDFLGWIALRGITSQMITKAGLVTTPTGTGNSVLVSGMSGQPQAILTFPTRMITAGALQTDDTSGSFGVGAICNDAGTTLYASNIVSSQDNVATSVAKCMASTATGLGILDNTGAYTVKSTLTSWDSGGATLNYSSVNASALQVAFLAFGMPSISLLPMISNNGGF